jgi:hypothetical protein
MFLGIMASLNVSKFWKMFFELLGVKVKLSITLDPPQMDEEIE